MRGYKRPGFLLVVAAALAVGALVSLLVVAQPRAQGQTPLLNEDEAVLLALINEYRSEHGLSELEVSPTLTAAARWMSEDMAEHDCLSHIDSLGRNPAERVAAFGYTQASWWGEVIGAGESTPEAAFEAWRDSPGHNTVMLTDAFAVAGLGKAYDSQSLYGWFWTVDFGDYDDSVTASTAASPMPTPTPTPTPSPTPTATPERMLGCPTAGKWSLAVWTGEDGTPTREALATCGEGTVAAAYYIDPFTQVWSRWFAGWPTLSSLTTLDSGQGIIALGG